ncbi:uncharacterized protein LOC116188273 [Punica granatum]|uniref:Uncharacterized protein LOC116188273 n=1 Tax=Punica granatum TaxID=22663 RepID=A0A6P8BRG5_PUNGR|nr:uncharacterized protein LOC116188273 [Punica granatum]
MGSATLHSSRIILPQRRPNGFPPPNFSANASLLPIGTRNPSLSLAFLSRFSPGKSPNPFSPVYSLPPLNPHSSEEQDEEEEIQGLRVPDSWSVPSKALEESEWLRLSLHKWLDDEYCPEETNVEVSKVAATSYYKSLLEKRTDLGEILLKMAKELESISYQDSFHGAFSSANAAVDLIARRIEQV